MEKEPKHLWERVDDLSSRTLKVGAVALAAVGGWALSNAVGMAETGARETSAGLALGVPVAKYTIATAYLMMRRALQKDRDGI